MDLSKRLPKVAQDLSRGGRREAARGDGVYSLVRLQAYSEPIAALGKRLA